MSHMKYICHVRNVSQVNCVACKAHEVYMSCKECESGELCVM